MSVQMTRVQKLELTHFRGIRHLTLDFTENVTVLVGVNGAGKTSVIEALRALLAYLLYEVKLQTEGNLSEYESSDDDGIKPIYLRSSDVHVEQRNMRLAIKAVVANRTLSWSVPAQSTLPGMLESKPELNDVFAFAEDLGTRVKEEPQTALPLAIYYAVGRDAGQEPSDEGSKNQLAAYEDALTGAGIIYSRPFVSWFRRREDYENERRVEDIDFRDAQLQSVRRATESLLPGFSNLRIRRQPTRRMVIRKGNTELELKHLSEGERYLLALGADISRRLALANPTAEQPEQCSAIILIDEIETHLHPSWQRHVIPALARAFPNCQFIVATHSPQVLSKVRPESIYLLTQEDGELRVLHPEASCGRDSNRILEDIMGVDERPSEIKQKLSDYFYLLDQGKMEEARSLRQELESLIGPSDPEFARADAITRARELLDEAHRQER